MNAYIYVSLYIYIYNERERDLHTNANQHTHTCTPTPPIKQVEALAASVTEQLKAHAAAHPDRLELHYGPNEADPGECYEISCSLGGFCPIFCLYFGCILPMYTDANAQRNQKKSAETPAARREEERQLLEAAIKVNTHIHACMYIICIYIFVCYIIYI